MAHPAFDFEVITPDGSAFRGRVTSVRLSGKDGSFGILARHAPLLAVVEAGIVRVSNESGKELAFAAGEGFVEVRGSGVRLLVDFCNARSQIDVSRAEKAKLRAKERMRSHGTDIDRLRAEAALRRAVARLSTATLAGVE